MLALLLQTARSLPKQASRQTCAYAGVTVPGHGDAGLPTRLIATGAGAVFDDYGAIQEHLAVGDLL